jgi:hypothetical protein
MTERRAAHNSTYPKVVVQWLNEALCFYQSLCFIDSFVLRSPARTPSVGTLFSQPKLLLSSEHRKVQVTDLYVQVQSCTLYLVRCVHICKVLWRWVC